MRITIRYNCITYISKEYLPEESTDVIADVITEDGGTTDDITVKV
jgi:hypothetical protein